MTLLEAGAGAAALARAAAKQAPATPLLPHPPQTCPRRTSAATSCSALWQAKVETFYLQKLKRQAESLNVAQEEREKQRIKEERIAHSVNHFKATPPTTNHHPTSCAPISTIPSPPGLTVASPPLRRRCCTRSPRACSRTPRRGCSSWRRSCASASRRHGPTRPCRAEQRAIGAPSAHRAYGCEGYGSLRSRRGRPPSAARPDAHQARRAEGGGGPVELARPQAGDDGRGREDGRRGGEGGDRGEHRRGRGRQGPRHRRDARRRHAARRRSAPDRGAAAHGGRARRGARARPNLPRPSHRCAHAAVHSPVHSPGTPSVLRSGTA